MKLIRPLFALALLSGVASTAGAQWDQNTQLSQDKLQLVSAGPYSPFGTYSARLLQSPGLPVVDIWCVDFSNNFANNRTYNFTRFDAGQSDFDSRTRFGYNSLDNYKKAAYLTQFFNGLTQATDVQDLHFAIWHVLNPSAPTNTRPGEAFWLAKLDDGSYANITTSDWFVVSDVTMVPGSPFQTGGSQEFLVTAAPEPSAILLVSTGLLGIVGLARVRRRNKKQD
jgi:hypothetical protein